MIIRPTTTNELLLRIEYRIYALLNKRDYATRNETYAAMNRATRYGSDDEKIAAMRAVEVELRGSVTSVQ